MLRHWGTPVLALALLSALPIGQGFLLLGPKFFHSNQDYTVVMGNFDSHFSDVDVLLRMEGHTDSGIRCLNLTRTAVVRQNTNTMVNFKVPPNLPHGHYSLSIASQHDDSMDRQISLVYREKSVSGLIQLNKPVFKPGDGVKFRVIVLDTELKPPAGIETVHVTVEDPEANVIRKWSNGRLHVGVFEGDLQIGPVPLMGKYNIIVKSDGVELVSKAFEVKEYVLAPFDVELSTTRVPLLEHGGLSLEIVAKYYVGQPVKGTAKVELYLEDDVLDQSKTIDVHAVARMELNFNEPLNMYYDQQVVRVILTFTEAYTNRTIVKVQPIMVFKYPYRVKLISDRRQFHPEESFDCTLRVEHHDRSPAKHVTAIVDIDGLADSSEQRYTTDGEGTIQLSLHPTKATEVIEISVNIGGNELFSDRISRQEHRTKTFIKVELNKPVRSNSPVQLSVRCNEEMPFFLYYVVSRGNIVDSGYVQPNRATKYKLRLNATDKMVPKAKVIVVTVAKSVVVFDSVDIDFKEFRNDFNLTIGATQIKPGAPIELHMTGRPGSYVALAAYDKSLLEYSNNHDLFWEDIVEMYDGFHAIGQNEFDSFHSMGLFARSFGNVIFPVAIIQSSRFGEAMAAPLKQKEISYRTNLAEAWLWQNLTIGQPGHSVARETVPDSTTAWHLTGFSIDPVRGLGIVRRPIEFTTTQSFYIVASLPYSIKRGEAVALQFFIFNNYNRPFKASVTLYNVDNQTEFVGRSAKESSHTKHVEARPNAAIPVSFMVKARKLGEMVVRVQATIDPATDTLEQVVRVIPESLMQQKRMSRIFCHNTYTNESSIFRLPMDKTADAGSQKVTFTVTPNLLTSVVENLGDLLSVPTGCGEQNMVRFVPNVVVLDYLTAIGSKDVRLIAKATNLLRQGYQNQMKYRQADGSFGVWSTTGGSVFLTAFVGKSLQAAAKYLSEVDSAKVLKVYDWLASKQHRTGRFDEVGPVYHKDMQGGLRNGIALTSYVLIAILEHPEAKKKHSTVIDKGIRYVTDNLGGIRDSYDLSIATYALMLHGHSSKDAFLAKLVGMATSLRNGTELYWERSSGSIETTAYALLSFVMGEKYVQGTAIMRWLVSKRYSTGSFPRTQDTFVGLRALTKLAEKISPARNDYSVQLRYGSVKNEFRVNSQDLTQLQHDAVVGDISTMEATVGGLGFALLELTYEYSMDLRNFTNRFALELEKTVSGSLAELQLRVCASFIPELSDSLSNMALIEVNFPSGYVVERKPISKASRHNPIKNIEIRFGSTSVVVYYDNMGTEKNCFTVTAYRRAKVALKRPAYVLVHDYYDPKLNAIKMYEVDSQGICDICEDNDCPSTCET